MIEGFHIKSLPRAYHTETARVMNRLPAHDILRRRPDGSAHQMFNIMIGEGLSALEAEMQRYEESRWLDTTPTDQPSLFYQTDLPLSFTTDYPDPNYLLNSAFEFHTIDNEPYEWSITGSGSLSSDAYFGRHSLKLTVGPGETALVVQEVRGLELSYEHPLSFSCWMTGSGDASVTLMTSARNMVNGDYRLISSAAAAFTSEWDRYDTSVAHVGFPLSEGRVIVQVVGGAETSEIYIDALQLEQHANPTLWRASQSDYAPWNVTGSWGGVELVAEINGAQQPLYYCDNNYDFYFRAVPTRATVSDETPRWLAPTTIYDSLIDYYDDEWRTEFAIENGKIVKNNADVPGEQIAEYGIRVAGLDSLELMPDGWSELLGLTMNRDLLFVLDKKDDEYGIMCLNPQYQIPDTGWLYYLNRIPLDLTVPSGASITLGLDEWEQESLALRIVDGETVSDYRIKLWYDYYRIDLNGRYILMRESYEDYGGISL